MEVRTTSTSEDIGKLVLRLAVGGLMLLHGIDKIRHGPGGIPELLQQHGLPAFLVYGVYAGEAVAPIFILFGFLTRVAALVVALTMVMAVYLALADKVFMLNESGGWAIELNALYFAGALALVFLGAGRMSVSRGRRFLD